VAHGADAHGGSVSIAPADVLERGGWLRCSEPFPHIVARNVFTPSFYDALERQIRTVLGRGLSETPAPGRFSRNLPGYDAYGIGLGQPAGEPTSLFLSPGWRDLLAGVWDIGRTPYVFVGAHHHTPGSLSGFVHNDFNPVWFPRSMNGGIQIPRQDLCSYKTGEGTLAEDERIEVVRGAALIFFCANDSWCPGDGGETGLYTSGDARVGDYVAGWAPENNTLISFECTPQSFHGFIGNVRIPRTSIIMWVHRPLEEAAALYGEERLERWKS